MIIYCKQSGEPPVPVTVRVEWQPDGTIKPLCYWTPDGACFKITTLSECVRMEYLKEHGEGLRFKVRSEITHAPEDCEELVGIRHDTCLYLEDGRYSRKNIIDARYSHEGKMYIAVTLDIFPDGDYEVVYFCVHGQRYMVEKTMAIEPRGSFSAGGIGLCHKVEARPVHDGDDEDIDPLRSVRRKAALYLELNKWFVIA